VATFIETGRRCMGAEEKVPRSRCVEVPDEPLTIAVVVVELVAGEMGGIPQPKETR